MRVSPMLDRLAEIKATNWQTHFDAVARKEAGEDILLMTVGDTDFPSSPIGVAGAIESLRAGNTGYTNILGEPPLRKKIAEIYGARIGEEVDYRRVCIAAGAQNALFNALLSVAGEGSEVIALEPLYATYPGTIAATGGKMVTCACRAEDDFHPRFEEIEAAITEKTRALLVTSPSNPTGMVFGRAEMERLGGIAEKHDLWVISDEVYACLVYEKEHVSAFMVPSLRERSIVLGSMSKSHAMAGWRIGWLILPEGSRLIEDMFRVVMANTTGLAGFLQEGVLAALEAEPLAMDGLLETYRRRRARLVEAFNAMPGLSCAPPDGGMFMLVDVRGSGITSEAFAARLLDETGVALLPADGFGPSAVGHIRVNIGVDDAILEEALSRMARFTASL